MAKSTTKITVESTLVLNAAEVEYLYELLQNHTGDAAETEEQQECRSAIWSELNNCAHLIGGSHATI